MKQNKEFINTLDYERIEFPVSKKGFDKTEVKDKVCINFFCYRNKLTYPIYIPVQKFRVQ